MIYEPLHNLVNQLLANGNRKEALGLCRQACEGPAASARDWLLYASLSMDSGNLATARVAYEQVLELEPAMVDAYFGLGKVLTTTGEYPAALQSLYKAAELQPDNPCMWLALGITSGLAGHVNEAEVFCRRSLELQPDSPEARFNLANALQAQGKLAAAEMEYEAGLRLKPDLVAAWFMLAQARFGLGKLTEAEAAATRALALDPHTGEAYFTLGSISVMRGATVQARDHFMRAAAMLPGIPDVHMRLGKVLFTLDEFERAANCFQSVVNLVPGSAEAHFMMGRCYQERKLPGKAELCYRKAIAIDKDHKQAHYSLASLYARMDRHDESAQHYAEILRINPNDEQARHLLAAQQGKTTATAPVGYVVTLFDGYADRFDKELDELGYKIPELLYDMISRHVTLAPASQDIIDLGCGTGLCAPLFRDSARTLHGVDLSPGMIEKAHERGLYDVLEVGDIVANLAHHDAAWDLAICTDVFIYVGALRDIFNACVKALRPGGWFGFSVESCDDTESYVLRNTGRYAHSVKYIRNLALETGFSEVDCRSVIVRKDKGGVDIHGYLFLLCHSHDECR